MPLLWAATSTTVARKPPKWIWRPGPGQESDPSGPDHDLHLIQFEVAVFLTALVVLAAEAAVLVVVVFRSDSELPSLIFAYLVLGVVAGVGGLVRARDTAPLVRAAPPRG
jgi:hypothetical protein